jgi:hypothetical protein
MRASDKARVLAALDAAVLLPGNVRLLEAVTPLLASTDGAILEHAARTAALMLDSSEPRRFDDWDIPADVVARACSGLSQVATRNEAPPPARLAALDALAEAAACPSPVAKLVNDGSAEIRRAALLALHPTDDLPATALRQALADRESGVVSAAAVAVCRRRRAGAKAPGAEPSVPIRTLALADSTPVEDAVELLPCLANGDSADKQALDQLKHSKVPALKARASEL